MTTYGIDSYHIAIGIGDAAIHLLVQNPDTSSAAVLRAILVDGGLSDNNVVKNIKWTMSSIVRKYKISTSVLQFDAIVITHWDADHYKGIDGLINDDIKQQKDANPSVDLNTLLIQFMKYGTAGRSDPQTVLYAPYWDPPKAGLNGRPKTFEDGGGTMNYDYDTGTLNGICKLNYTSVLGVNFLENSVYTSGDTSSPKALFNANPPIDTAMPGIYCVGTNSKRYLKVKTKGIVEIVNLPGTTSTNKASIFAMVIWKDGRLSHYFAGDADYGMEGDVAQWSGTSGDTTVTGGSIVSMKLSHHGARSSTPVDIVKLYSPQNIIISCGADYGHPCWELLFYLDAWLLSQGSSKAGLRPIYCTQFPYYLAKDATTLTYNNTAKVNPETFRDDFHGKGPRGKYITALQALYDEIDKTTHAGGTKSPNLIKTYADWKAKWKDNAGSDPSDGDIQQWICGQVEGLWPKWSHSYEGSLPASSAAFTGPDNLPVFSHKQYIRYILVECRSGPTDGTVRIQRVGDMEEGLHTTIPSSYGKYSAGASRTASLYRSRPYSIPEPGKIGGIGGIRTLKYYTPDPATDPSEMDVSDAGSGDDSDAGNGDDSDDEGMEVPTPSRLSHDHAAVGEDASDDDDPTYYIYGSDLKGQVPSTANVLATGSDLDEFVNLLHRCVVGLVAALVASSDTDFDGEDEWFCWLQDSIQATELSATADDTAATITAFTIKMTSPADTVQSPPPATASSPLTFSTIYAAFALGLDSDLSTSLPGYVSDVATIAFGLDTSSPELDMTLPEVFTYVGLTNMTSSPVMTLMGVINLTLKPQDSKGCRNAVWFNPNMSYNTLVRLQFGLADGALDSLNTFLQTAIPSFTLDSVAVIARKTSTWGLASDGVAVLNDGDVVLTANWTFKPDKTSMSFAAAVIFHESTVKIELSTTTKDSLEDILAWLATVCGVAKFDLGDWLKNLDPSGTQLRRITITLNIVDQKPKLVGFSVDMEVGVTFGTAGGTSTVVFLLSYDWATGSGGTLRGALWCAPPPALAYAKLLPTWEDYLTFEPISEGPLSETLDLETMIPGGSIENFPGTIPTPQISQASLEIDGTGIEFSGAIMCDEPKRGPDPTIYLGKIKLYARYTFSGSIFELAFDMTALIEPPAQSKYQAPAMLIGKLGYDGAAKSWKLNASLQDLYGSTMYSFFNQASIDGGVMTFLESLEIKYLGLEYDYLTTGNEFHFTGTILLGELELDLNYDYTPKDWTFAAKLSQNTDTTSTIGEIVNSIIGSASDDLPSFVSSISVSNDNAVYITCKKPKDGSLLFAGSVIIGVFQLSIVQYRDTAWKADISPKRAIKVSITKLPEIEVPLIGNLTQPFDEMYYLWVQDGSNQNQTDAGPGLTQPEVNSINDELSTLNDKLLVKNVSSKPKDTDVVISAGSHFVLVLKNEKGEKSVVLDYVFGKPKAPQDSSTRDKLATTGDSSSASSDSSMAAYKKSIGPLSISNIGFQIKGDTLSILLDATLALGPISFTLIGFGLGLEFSGGFNLQNLPDVKPSLHGLAVAFNQPPVVIAGLFEHVVTKTTDLYAGGVIVAVEPYLFEAAGFYGTITVDHVKHPTAFIFGLLDGPLVTLEFAEISGITGGFGYNCALRFPSVSQVLEFPFISMKSPNTSPMETLLDLVGGSDPWFSPAEGSFWVAAGLKVTAFEALVIDAVVVVEWNPSVCLAIFGVAAADIPAAPEVKEKFARVELGIAATVNFDAGVMKFEGQLTPNSYVLSPDCHLTGGFALYYWFQGSDPSMQGDWVFTIGGFHQAFKRPSQYPNPPRLGIDWSLDGSLSITGQAYFAITPKVCMGGGLLHASLSLGPLAAFFDAYADFLINYKPFHFIADAGISVGVRYTLDLWLATIHISVEIGAHLYLQGPPLSGTVHVDFWVFGFDISFGPGAAPIEAVDLNAFYELVYQSSIQPAASTVSLAEMGRKETKASAGNNDHIFSCQSGMIPPTSDGSQETPQGTPWVVRAGNFSFGISCRMAIDTADIADITANVPPCPTPIYAKPMQLQTPLSSSMTITISSNPTPADKYLWKIEPAMKFVPDALWGIYDPGEDPSKPSSNVSGLLNGDNVAISLIMGVVISAPDPILSDDVIPKFNAVQEASENVFPENEEKYFPTVESSNGDWLPLKGSGDTQWAEVKAAWLSPKMGKASPKNTVDLWSKVFAWSPTETLSGSAPTNLLQNFGDLYLEAPLLSVISDSDDSSDSS